MRLLSDRVFAFGFVLLFVSFLHHVRAGGGADRHGAWLVLFALASVLTLSGLTGRWYVRSQA